MLRGKELSEQRISDPCAPKFAVVATTTRAFRVLRVEKAQDVTSGNLFVEAGGICEQQLEIRCSVQLSYGRNLLCHNVLSS